MYTSLFTNCNGYWDLRNNVLPIIGTVSGTITEAATTSDRFGLLNRGYLFDGSNDKITMGNTAVSIKSLLMWIKLGNTTTSICKLTDTPHKLTVESGTLTIIGWPTTVATFVDGVSGSTLDTSWHMIVVTTTGTAFAASNLILGYDGTAYYNGSIGEVMTFSSQLTGDEITTLYKIMSKKSIYPVITGCRNLS